MLDVVLKTSKGDETYHDTTDRKQNNKGNSQEYEHLGGLHAFLDLLRPNLVSGQLLGVHLWEDGIDELFNLEQWLACCAVRMKGTGS